MKIKDKPTKTALISVFHKDGIIDFALELIKLGFTILASGGTAKHLTKAGIKVRDVTDLVGGGPILGHRVVTLSREIHAGLLARDTAEDLAELEHLGIPFIDLVCVDLYPLEQEIEGPESTLASVIEMTDIGGPTMIRSAAKGCRIVICDPSDRAPVIEWLKGDQNESGLIGRLCAKAEYVIAKYCLASARYRSNGHYDGLLGEQIAQCKYGENAWQTPAAVFSCGSGDPFAPERFVVVEGTMPSYNNRRDIDRQLQTVSHIAAAFRANRGSSDFIAVATKHGNACGAAVGHDCLQVLKNMADGDRKALFGGLVMANFVVGEQEAVVLEDITLDGITAPGFTQGAIDMLRRKKTNKCRFITNQALLTLSLDTANRFRPIRGGFLLQPNYTYVPNFKQKGFQRFGTITQSEEDDLLLAWAIGSTSNSNTITIVKNRMLLGNGVGQRARDDAAELAVHLAQGASHVLHGASAYSDSFFPFPDGPKILADAGVTAIFTSSGSIRDEETIALCQERHIGLIMVPDAEGRGFFDH